METKFDISRYTKYEKARILGARALQISANAPILIKLSEEELQKIHYDPVKIAELEFEQGILPITVSKPLPRKIGMKKPKVEVEKEEELEKEIKKIEKEEENKLDGKKELKKEAKNEIAKEIIEEMVPEELKEEEEDQEAPKEKTDEDEILNAIEGEE